MISFRDALNFGIYAPPAVRLIDKRGSIGKERKAMPFLQRMPVLYPAVCMTDTEGGSLAHRSEKPDGIAANGGKFLRGDKSNDPLRTA